MKHMYYEEEGAKWNRSVRGVGQKAVPSCDGGPH